MTVEVTLYRAIMSENRYGTASTPWIGNVCVSLLDPTERRDWRADGAALRLTNAIGHFFWIEDRGWCSEGGDTLPPESQLRISALIARISVEYVPNVCPIPMADQIAADEARRHEIRQRNIKTSAEIQRRNDLIDNPR